MEVIMSEKELQTVIDEKVEQLENVVEVSTQKLDQVVKKVQDDKNFDKYVRAGMVVTGATLIAGYFPLRKKHRKLATATLLLGAGVLAAEVVRTVLEDDKK
jgi:hypothetical protein